MAISDFNKLSGSDVFGRYCRIEMKNFISPNDFFIHKCIGTHRGNCYRDVPLVAGKGEYVHTGGLIDLVRVITCGIDETEVFAVPLESVEFIPSSERTCHMEYVEQPVGFTLKCDVCGNELGVYETEVERYAYCPHCGARVVSGDAD